MPTERLKVNLLDIGNIDTRRFLNLLDVSAWDALKNRVLSPLGGAGIKSARKKRLAEAKERMQELFGGGEKKEAVSGEEEPAVSLNALIKELLERR